MRIQINWAEVKEFLFYFVTWLLSIAVLLGSFLLVPIFFVGITITYLFIVVDRFA